MSTYTLETLYRITSKNRRIEVGRDRDSTGSLEIRVREDGTETIKYLFLVQDQAKLLVKALRKVLGNVDNQTVPGGCMVCEVWEDNEGSRVEVYAEPDGLVTISSHTNENFVDFHVSVFPGNAQYISDALESTLAEYESAATSKKGDQS